MRRDEIHNEFCFVLLVGLFAGQGWVQVLNSLT